jgi:hypothetical protein
LWRDIAMAGLLAVATTALEVHFSAELGLLAYPPYNDGIGYLLEAKSVFYRLRHEPGPALSTLAGRRASLWEALMILSFAMLGEGEWQAYTIRFWPVFLPPAYGCPATLLYYMMDEAGRPWGIPTLDRGAGCKAILSFRGQERMEEIGRFFPSHYYVTWPTFSAIGRWVKKRRNGYVLLSSYPLSDHTAPQQYRFGDGKRRGFTLELYVRE